MQPLCHWCWCHGIGIAAAAAPGTSSTARVTSRARPARRWYGDAQRYRCSGEGDRVGRQQAVAWGDEREKREETRVSATRQTAVTLRARGALWHSPTSRWRAPLHVCSSRCAVYIAHASSDPGKRMCGRRRDVAGGRGADAAAWAVLTMIFMADRR